MVYDYDAEELLEKGFFLLFRADDDEKKMEMGSGGYDDNSNVGFW